MVDENLPPALAKSLAALFVGRHDVVHLRERFDPGVEDTQWIGELSAEGQWAIISGDRRMTRNRAEKQLFQHSNLIGFFFSRSLQKAKLTRKMERLMALWETIEAQAKLVRGGSMFEIGIRSSKLKTL